MITELLISDLVALEKFARFPLPNLSAPQYILKGSVLDRMNLVGSFWVKITTESSLIVNPSYSNFVKAKAIKEIFEYIKNALLIKGFDDSHLFIEDDPCYVELLKKHFGFKDSLGTALYIGAKNGKVTD